jgi:hypothetical protein
MAVKQKPNVQFCMPNRTKCTLLVSLMCGSRTSTMVRVLQACPTTLFRDELQAYGRRPAARR